jgi:hypothetical protein
LEHRALLASSVNLTNIFGFQVNTNLNIPITFEQKALRIERLPFYLEKIRPGRFLPQAEMVQIQGGLNGLMDAIQKPPASALNNYNYQLRHVVPKQSLTAEDTRLLNHAFTAVLRSAHAPKASIDEMSTALNQLVTKVDPASPLPVYLATNDYTLVLETALGVGRPMPPPILPRIAKNQGIQAGPQHIKTPLHHPALVGTYHYHTTLKVIDDQGNVVGEAPARKNNDYRIVISTRLSLGDHEFHLVAYDTVGHASRPSRPFIIRVVPPRHRPIKVIATPGKTPEPKT